jgi:hypothetical protein
MPWIILLIILGAALPITMAAAAAFMAIFRTRGAGAGSGIARAFSLGMVYGVLGGIAVCAAVIGLVLLLRSVL